MGTRPWLEDQTGHFKGQPRKEKAVGYCHNKSHHGYLSLKAMRQHQCTKKGCHYFEKYEDHPFWIEKRKRKEAKKARKNGEYIEDIKGTITDSPDGIIIKGEFQEP